MTLTLNGKDARATFGLILAETPGWLDAVPTRYPTTAIPGRPGVVALAGAEDGPRKLTLRGVVQGTSASDCRAKLDKLDAALRAKAVTLSFADLPTRQYTAQLDGIVVDPAAAALIADTLPVTISLTCLDPYAYDVAKTSLATATNNAAFAMAQGTGVVRPVFTINGPATNPTLTFKDATATVFGSMGFTVTLIAGDKLVIDCAAMTVRLNGVNRLDTLTSGDFIAIDGAIHADFLAPNWPTVTPAGLGAGGLLQIDYYKAWR